jgi:glucose-6-phosphate isomerase
VVAISKSGQTLTQLEALSQFLDFPVIVITEPGSSLEQIAQKMSWEIFKHPPFGGRFTSFTEVTLLPAMLCGLEVEYFLKGGQEVHALFSQENLPAKMAAALYDLEKQGFVDVLSLVYSHALVGSSNLIMQLCHESYGKNEQGQTFLVCEGPEVQHYTMQRFLGGTKNMIGVYVSTHASSQVTESVFPSQLHSTVVRGRHLFDLQKIPLHTVLNLEMQASLESATGLGLPVIHLELTSTDPASVGKWIAFWQLFAVYSSLLRKVNPFDQPAVEHFLIGCGISRKRRARYGKFKWNRRGG